jgi:spore germination protein YaaH
MKSDALLVATSVFLATTTKPTQADAATNGRIESLGFYTGLQTSYGDLVASQADLTIVSADLYDVTIDGGVIGGDAFNAAGFGRDAGLATYALVGNYNPATRAFDAAIAHSAMVTDESAAIASILALAARGHYVGIDLDFENLSYSPDIATDRAAFTTFVHDLSTALHAQQLNLIVSVPPKAVDDPANTWSYPFDLAALAPAVDYLHFMTYDQHGPGSTVPGPVASLGWVTKCATYAVSVVPPAKLLVGLPAYGYDWDLTDSNADAGVYAVSEVDWVDLPPILATPGAVLQWSSATSSPYVNYTSADGHSHVMWYENQQSIEAKAKLVNNMGLAGIAIWALGKEDATFWTAVQSATSTTVPAVPEWGGLAMLACVAVIGGGAARRTFVPLRGSRRRARVD